MDTGRHIARREQGPEHLEKMEERVPGTGPPKPAHSPAGCSERLPLLGG